MKNREILILGLIIITVCAVSLIPFSNSILEGNRNKGDSSGSTTTPAASTAATTAAGTTSGTTTTPAATTSGTTTTPSKTTTSGTTTTPAATTSGTTTTPSKTTTSIITKTVSSNTDFLNAVINALGSNPNPSTDKVNIYKIQGMISSLNTQNSATLLGEIGNPNNLNDPRLFLQYMNWFGSKCPVDSNNCTGLGSC